MQVQSCSQLPIETESKHLEINTEFQLSAGGHSTSASKWQAWNKRGQGSNNWINTFVYLYMVSNDIDSVDWRFGLNQMPETPCQARPLCPLCWDSDHCGNVGRFSLGGRGHRKTTGSSVKQPVGLNLVVLDNQDTPPALLLLLLPLLLLAILFKEIELVFLRETVVLLLTEAPVPFPPSGEGEVGHLKAPPTPLFHLLLYLLLYHLLGAPLGLWASPVAIAWGWGEGGREGGGTRFTLSVDSIAFTDGEIGGEGTRVNSAVANKSRQTPGCAQSSAPTAIVFRLPFSNHTSTDLGNNRENHTQSQSIPTINISSQECHWNETGRDEEKYPFPSNPIIYRMIDDEVTATVESDGKMAVGLDG